MDFDEYEYLEKTVEDLGNRSGSSKKKENSEKREKGYRKREEEEDEEEEERKSKKSRSREENGERKRDERERSERRREKEERHRSDRDGERDREKERERRDREKEDIERERTDRDKERERRERVREKERERDRDKERERAKEKDREMERERSGRSSSRSRRRDSRERESDKELREMEREIEMRESRRYKEKKVEPEADPERDQRTVFAYQMPLKATERDVYEFFSKAGKVRDVRLIMDRNSRRSKGVGYIEFYDVMSVPMAIALSGQLFLGQPVMVKPSEAEKNLVQSTSGGASTVIGPYGPTDRKLYVGNLHFNMTEHQLRQIFEPFGPVELVQLPLDLETGQCKGFGFVQFAQVEHAKAAQSLNGKLEIAGRIIKVSSVTEHVGGQDPGTSTADFDDNDGGGLGLNARSRALLMQKLDRTGTASSIAGSLGAPVLNGSTPIQQPIALPSNGQGLIPAPALPGQVHTSPAPESVGVPSECLLLKNLFDPATETDPEFDLDIKEDVEEECSKFGRVDHIYVDKNTAGHVYLRFESKEAAANAQRGMHLRWFARRLISAVFMQPHEYAAKFTDGGGTPNFQLKISCSQIVRECIDVGKEFSEHPQRGF
ncbi:hypothetical protein Nepgr_008505 [Nepenthes gracilis]|uniref:RRM domain-containing protein n=1 Tax=Nepenthes gracilis TaxID=150966 RepID=A0AAD3S8T8_NEPGR|nr:hypothetical protein Nepgr_008505 [Nepenthes gracilis]